MCRMWKFDNKQSWLFFYQFCVFQTLCVSTDGVCTLVHLIVIGRYRGTPSTGVTPFHRLPCSARLKGLHDDRAHSSISAITIRWFQLCAYSVGPTATVTMRLANYSQLFANKFQLKFGSKFFGLLKRDKTIAGCHAKVPQRVLLPNYCMMKHCKA